MNKKIARITQDKKLLLANEIVEDNRYSLNEHGKLYTKNILEGNKFSIDDEFIEVGEFIEGYPFVKPVIDDSLVLWLDGSTGNNYEQTGTWKDLSGNGNDGQLRNFGYTEDSGWVDGGLRFDGVDDYVDCGSILNEDYEGFTVEATIIFSKKSLGSSNMGYIVHKNINYTEGNAPFVLMTSDSNIVWQVNSSSNGYLRIYVGGYMDGKPHLVHGIYSNNKIMIYVDGALEGKRTIKPFENNNGKIGIGSSCYSGSYDRPFKGEIHSIRLYNRALTDEEILQNYQAGQCSPLLAMRGDV